MQNFILAPMFLGSNVVREGCDHERSKTEQNLDLHSVPQRNRDIFILVHSHFEYSRVCHDCFIETGSLHNGKQFYVYKGIV